VNQFTYYSYEYMYPFTPIFEHVCKEFTLFSKIYTSHYRLFSKEEIHSSHSSLSKLLDIDGYS